MVNPYSFFVILSVLLFLGHANGAKSTSRHSHCGPTVTKEMTVVATTVLKTCGIRPTTQLPACIPIQSVDQTPTEEPHLHTSEETESSQEEDDEFFELPYGRNSRKYEQDEGYLRTALRSLTKRCPPTSYSLTEITKTATMLSSYTCYDPAANSLYPDYPFCNSVTAVTCGIIPAGKIAKCPPGRSYDDFHEDYAPTNMQSIETTTLPELVQGKKNQNNLQDRLVTSLSEHAADFLIRNHYKDVFGTADGRVLDITTQTVPYRCQGPQGFLPAVPPCSLAETVVKLNCTIIRDSTDGEIYSPNYPKNYVPNSNACWTILAPEGSRIKLLIQEFITEKDKDVLRIYDGVLPIKSPAPMILSGTGNTDLDLPVTFTSTSNKVYLKFYSDGENQYKGFEIDYFVISE